MMQVFFPVEKRCENTFSKAQNQNYIRFMHFQPTILGIINIVQSMHVLTRNRSFTPEGCFIHYINDFFISEKICSSCRRQLFMSLQQSLHNRQRMQLRNPIFEVQNGKGRRS